MSEDQIEDPVENGDRNEETSEELEERLLKEFHEEMKRLDEQEAVGQAVDRIGDLESDAEEFWKNKEYLDTNAEKQESSIEDVIKQKEDDVHTNDNDEVRKFLYYLILQDIDDEVPKKIVTEEEKVKNDLESKIKTELKSLNFEELRVPLGYKEKKSPASSIYFSRNTPRAKKLVLLLQGSGKSLP